MTRHLYSKEDWRQFPFDAKEFHAWLKAQKKGNVIQMKPFAATSLYAPTDAGPMARDDGRAVEKILTNKKGVL